MQNSMVFTSERGLGNSSRVLCGNSSLATGYSFDSQPLLKSIEPGRMSFSPSELENQRICYWVFHAHGSGDCFYLGVLGRLDPTFLSCALGSTRSSRKAYSIELDWNRIILRRFLCCAHFWHPLFYLSRILLSYPLDGSQVQRFNRKKKGFLGKFFSWGWIFQEFIDVFALRWT